MRTFLFLQGPVSPFFTRVANGLVARGHAVHAIFLSLGDRLFWRRKDGVSYRGTLQEWPDFIAAFLQQHRVTDLVLLGEQRSYHRIAIEQSKQRAIRVTVTDFGYLRPDWITLEQDGMSGCSLFPRQPESIRALASACPAADLTPAFRDSFWTMALWDMVYHLGNSFLWWSYPRYQSHKLENPVLVYLGTGFRLATARFKRPAVRRLMAALRRDRIPYFVFPLQMAHDFQLRAYSPFPDQAGAIGAVVSSFAAHAPSDAHLLVKVHPWDNGMIGWGRLLRRLAHEHRVERRVHYVDGGDLDEMVPGSRGMVTINSTSGLRALILGRPVTTLGQAIYDVPGLTWSGGLDRFWREAAPPDAGLLEDYVRAMAATIQVRGVFYSGPGLAAAVAETVDRLHAGHINQVLPR